MQLPERSKELRPEPSDYEVAMLFMDAAEDHLRRASRAVRQLRKRLRRIP